MRHQHPEPLEGNVMMVSSSAVLHLFSPHFCKIANTVCLLAFPPLIHTVTLYPRSAIYAMFYICWIFVLCYS